ncbi:hypothetical protein [Cupriavidus basilensis]
MAQSLAPQAESADRQAVLPAEGANAPAAVPPLRQQIAPESLIVAVIPCPGSSALTFPLIGHRFTPRDREAPTFSSPPSTRQTGSADGYLEEALDDLTVPTTRAGKIGKTPVKKIGMLSASVELGEEPTRRKLPDDPALRFDTLVARLASQSGHTILLMLDEVQVLAELADGRSAIATIRAVLQKRKRDVLAVFTGSSQEALAAMTVASGGPMYQFAQLLDFPTLGIEYPKALAKHFTSVHTDKTLDVDALVKAFEYLGHKPALMKDLVKWMSAEGMTDVQLALNRFVQDGRLIAGWEGLLASLQPFEQVLLSVIAKGHAPFAKGTITLLNKDSRFHRFGVEGPCRAGTPAQVRRSGQDGRSRLLHR